MTIVRLALLPVVLFLSSCIAFTSQTMTFRYDQRADRLHIFQIYQGIHGKDAGAGLTVEERKELESVIKGERTFFFANWITEFSRAGIEKSVKELEAKKEKTKNEKLNLARMKMVLANVKVRNGRFYLDARNRLSGYQYVTVSHFSKLLEAANRAISQSVKNVKADKKILGFDLGKKTRARLKKAAAGDFAWIKMKGNRLILTMPMTYPDYLKVRMEMAATLRKRLEKKNATVDSIRKVLNPYVGLIENDAQISYENNAFTVKVGHPKSRYTPVYMRLAGNYKPNAAAYVAQRCRKTNTRRIAALIEQLGHDDHKQREAAAAELRSESAWAHALLENAKNHENPVIRARVRSILQAVNSRGQTKGAQAAPPAVVMKRMQAFLLAGRVPDQGKSC